MSTAAPAVRHVLVVDDSISVQQAVRSALAGLDGCRLSVSGHANAAGRLMETDGADLVLVDVVLPDASGYDLCRSLKQGSHPPVVLLLTSSFEPFDEAEARACGADGVQGKPFTANDLRARVKEALAAMGSPANGQAPAPEARSEPRDEKHEVDLGEIARRLREPVAEQLLEPVVERLAHRFEQGDLPEGVAELIRSVAERMVRRRLEELEADAVPSSKPDD